MRRLNIWLQVLILIIGAYGIALFTFNADDIAKIIIGMVITITSVAIVSEYGTIFNKLEYKIAKFMSK